MVNEDGKIEIGVGVNTEELDKYSKKLDKILKQMQQVNGTTVKSTSSVKTLDDKTKKLRETASKTVSGNGSRGLSLSPLLNKIPMYSQLSGSLGNIRSGVNSIKESAGFGRETTRNIHNKTERLSKCFEKLSTKTNVAQARLGAVAEKGGVVGKATEGLSKGFSKIGSLMTRIGGLIRRVGVALGGAGIAIGVFAGVIGGAILAITGMVAASAVATKKMKEFASTADNLVKERRSYDPTTATEAGAYRQGLIRQTGKFADKLGRLATTLANSDVIKFSGMLDLMRRRYSDVDGALDRHAKTTMRVTAFMDTLGIYLDSLKMGVLDLIEPIISNTESLKGLATAIDVVTTPLMWIGKGLAIFAQKIGEVLSVIGSFVSGVINFVSEIPILGDFVKDALKSLDDKSSHAARDFVDDMENVFKKYESGYSKDPYKLNTGLHNLSFMDYGAERSPADNGVPTDDKEITDVTNNSLMHLLKSNFNKFTKPLLDSGFTLVGNIVERLDTIFTFIKKTAETIFYFWTTLFQKAQDIVTKAKEFFGGIVTKAKTFFEGIVTKAKTFFEGIVTKAKEFFGGIVTKAKEFFEGIVTNAKTFFEGIVTKAKTFFEGIVTKAKTFFEGIVTKAKEFFGGIVTKAKEFFEGIVTKAKTFFEGIVTKAKTFFEGIVTKAKTFFKPLIEGIKNIGTLINNVISAIKNIKIDIPFIGSSSSSSSKKKKEPLPEPTISPDPLNGKTPKGSETHYFGPNNALALSNTQASASAKDSNKSLELVNSHSLPYTDRSKELKILDPRNVDIKIHINTEKADKDFVEKMTEKLKKSFLEGLLYDY